MTDKMNTIKTKNYMWQSKKKILSKVNVKYLLNILKIVELI